MPIRTILVALALEDDSTHVADRAVQLTTEHGAQLVGIHVMEDMPFRDANLPTSVDTTAITGMLEHQATTRLQSLLGNAPNPAQIHIEAGKPYDMIQRLAVSCGADMIVIGPGIAKTLREKVLGSTADRVIRYAPCPVLVVRSTSAAPYRHIAVGVDFSAHAQAAALWATRVSPTATRELIHTVEIPLAFEQAMLKTGTPQAEIERYRAAKAQEARQLVISTYGESGRLPPRTRARIVHGHAAITLLNASRRRTVDLVAIGTQGLNAVAQYLVGSVTRKILAGASGDVLVVPAPTS